MKCANCGSLIEEHYDYCANCGSNISEQKIRRLVIHEKKFRITKIIMLVTIFIFFLLFSYNLLFNFNRAPSLQGVWDCGDYDSNSEIDLDNINYYFRFEFMKDGTFKQLSLDGQSIISGSYTESDLEIPENYVGVASVKKIGTFSSSIDDNKGYFEKTKSNTYEVDIYSQAAFASITNLNTSKMYICSKK